MVHVVVDIVALLLPVLTVLPVGRTLHRLAPRSASRAAGGGGLMCTILPFLCK